jgi:succinate dehydrogenase/fumarate reductase cytochrome b subunit
MRSFICAALLTNHGFTISVFVAVAITATFAFVFEAPPELVATVLVLGILTARGFNSASGIPHTISTWTKTYTREPPKTKAQLREMLTEAVRNTQPEPKRLPKANKDRG